MQREYPLLPELTEDQKFTIPADLLKQLSVKQYSLLPLQKVDPC